MESKTFTVIQATINQRPSPQWVQNRDDDMACANVSCLAEWFDVDDSTQVLNFVVTHEQPNAEAYRMRLDNGDGERWFELQLLNGEWEGPCPMSGLGDFLRDAVRAGYTHLHIEEVG